MAVDRREGGGSKHYGSGTERGGHTKSSLL